MVHPPEESQKGTGLFLLASDGLKWWICCCDCGGGRVANSYLEVGEGSKSSFSFLDKPSLSVGRPGDGPCKKFILNGLEQKQVNSESRRYGDF